MDSLPPISSDGGDSSVDSGPRDAGADLGDGPIVRPDSTDDVIAPDLPLPDTTVDTLPTNCLSCGALGCNVTLSRCNRLAPSNIPAALLQTLHDDPLLDDCSLSYSFDPPADGEKGSFGGCRSQGSVNSTRDGVYWGTITLANGELATLFAMNSLIVQGNVTLHAEGPYPIIVYARQGITLRGLVDASAVSELEGPGGKAGGRADGVDGEACGGGQGQGGDLLDINTDKSGGGGGGWGQRGAAGGTAGSILGGAGGSLPITATGRALEPLRGGCGGGAGGGSSGDGGFGGAGGGAIQFSAGTLLIVDGKGIRASGGGGGGGSDMDAGGGGSGGSILLEAAEVRVTSTTPLSANGGGGGAGALPGEFGQYGHDGEHSTSQAAGGIGVAPAGGGGLGGARGADPSFGADSTHSGGGGGGAGRIHIRARVGILQSQLLSPQATSDPAPSVW